MFTELVNAFSHAFKNINLFLAQSWPEIHHCVFHTYNFHKM